MIDLKTETHSLIENFELMKGLLATYGPDSFQSLRERAFRSYSEFGIPSTKDEEFKYLSLRALEEGRFNPAYGATLERSQLEETVVGKIDAITVTFVNGEHAPELSTDDILPEGAFIGSLKDGLVSYEETIVRHIGEIATLRNKLGSSNDDRFVQLNTAFLGEGAFVYLAEGVSLDRPIHLVFLSTADHGPLASHPRTLIVFEENSDAKVLESYIGLQGTYFTNAVTEVFLGPNAILEHTKFQYECAEAVHIGNTSVHQCEHSIYTSNNVNFGAKIARNDVNVWLGGERTESWLNGVSVGLGEQVIDNHTRIDHAKPNCNSFEVYKAILGGHATGVFNGKIFVYEDAQKTDAKQTNQALLLSRTATINTKPQLEIFADDVKCTHGATVGQLREEAVFYLQSRGIPKPEAEALLVFAFAAEVLLKTTIPGVREALEKVLFARLGEAQHLPVLDGD
jgi:Fe-S cluster assembly protein SufD